MEWLVSFYPWTKALHIISVIAWMAGIFYLPRLFVYHADAAAAGEPSATFKVMERRLYKAIMTPAMIATWILGLALMYVAQAWTQPWFHAKLVLVIAMSGLHGWLGARLRDFANDANRHTARTYRIVNELPTLLVVLIVILAVVKPF